MPRFEVTKYKLVYDVNDKKAFIHIFYNMDGKLVGKNVEIAPEFTEFVANMLRFEKPIYWNSDSEKIETGNEEIGEQEL
jgi:hypothetical protein